VRLALIQETEAANRCRFVNPSSKLRPCAVCVCRTVWQSVWLRTVCGYGVESQPTMTRRYLRTPPSLIPVGFSSMDDSNSGVCEIDVELNPFVFDHVPNINRQSSQEVNGTDNISGRRFKTWCRSLPWCSECLHASHVSMPKKWIKITQRPFGDQ